MAILDPMTLLRSDFERRTRLSSWILRRSDAHGERFDDRVSASISGSGFFGIVVIAGRFLLERLIPTRLPQRFTACVTRRQLGIFSARWLTASWRSGPQFTRSLTVRFCVMYVAGATDRLNPQPKADDVRSVAAQSALSLAEIDSPFQSAVTIEFMETFPPRSAIVWRREIPGKYRGHNENVNNGA